MFPMGFKKPCTIYQKKNMEQENKAIEMFKKLPLSIRKQILSWEWFEGFKQRNSLEEKSRIEISVDSYMKDKDNDKA